MDDARLPTKLWLDTHLHNLTIKGISYYVTQTGNHASGLILLKINNLEGIARLLVQQRDFDGVMQWMNALGRDVVPEKDADDYIRRSIERDPDLWVIEVEDRAMKNPFSDRSL